MNQDNFKYLWTAYFEDGKVLEQSADDSYSDYAAAEYSSTSLEALFDYSKKAKLIYFDINDGTFAYGIDLPSRRFGINGTWFSLPEEVPLEDIRLEYLYLKKDDDSEYCDFGYSGKDFDGKRIAKTIRIQ